MEEKVLANNDAHCVQLESPGSYQCGRALGADIEACQPNGGEAARRRSNNLLPNPKCSFDTPDDLGTGRISAQFQAAAGDCFPALDGCDAGRLDRCVELSQGPF